MLVRFRADPAVVRVSIRRVQHITGHAWCCTVKARDGSWRTSAQSMTPTLALNAALKRVADYEGIDLDMQWSYDHPQG